MDDLVTVGCTAVFRTEQAARFRSKQAARFRTKQAARFRSKQVARFRTEQAATVMTYSTVGSHQHSILDKLYYETNLRAN